MPNILIIDPADAVREALSAVLKPMGFNVSNAATCAGALDFCKAQQIDIAMADIGAGGLELAEQVLEHNLDTLIILTDTIPAKNSALKALRAGAFDYLRKPLRVAEFVEAVQRGLAARGHEDTANLANAHSSVQFSWDACFALAGKSAAIRDLRENLLALQQSGRRPPVLIQGESGVGKLQVAEALHLVCCGHDKPFVVYNCAEKSTLEIEEDIYGQGVGGGVLQSAKGGTLVLEYIEKIDPDLQNQLVEVFGQQTGSGWLVCLAQCDLEEEMLAGNVSTGFAYYLMDTVLSLPPLRSRMEDLEDLVNHVVKHSLAIPPQARNTQFEPAVLDLIRKTDWPNNILGLEQYVIYCVSKGRLSGNTITLEVARRYMRQMQGQG